MRLIVFLALCLLLYYLVKNYLKEKSGGGAGYRPGTSGRPPAPVTDQLVQDPVCGVYCAKKDAFPLIWKGKAYYFCSEECRDKFKKEHGKTGKL